MFYLIWLLYGFQAKCNKTNAVTFGEYSQAWDFRATAVGLLEVDVYSNTSKDPDAGNQSPPLNLRINQVCCPPSVPCVVCASTLCVLLSESAGHCEQALVPYPCMH